MPTLVNDANGTIWNKHRKIACGSTGNEKVQYGKRYL